MLTHLRNLFPADRFFLGLVAVSVLSAVGFWQRPLFYLAILLLGGLLVGFVVDARRLYRLAAGVSGQRTTPRAFSLGDALDVRIRLHNAAAATAYATVTDEQPVQLQVRGQRLAVELPPGEARELRYAVLPRTRGDYAFGRINVFLRTDWRLVERRLRLGAEQTVPVYPSIVQMQQFALRARTHVPAPGSRRLRRLTRSYEFDQIKEYVRGDDFRSINWRATGRRNELMVNQYEEERAQRVFCVIDKGRTMLMPFGGLSLLDYAINASLALSKVVLDRDDRAGLVTFADRIGTVLPADSKPDQLRRILGALYREEERPVESDYDLLYYASRRLVGGRSLFLLFSNFESNYALDRTLPGLRRIARTHRLVVVLFENTEVAALLDPAPVTNAEDVYLRSTARGFLQDRRLMAARLRRNGIQVILTRPEELTGAVVERYLALKARGI